MPAPKKPAEQTAVEQTPAEAPTEAVAEPTPDLGQVEANNYARLHAAIEPVKEQPGSEE